VALALVGAFVTVVLLRRRAAVGAETRSQNLATDPRAAITMIKAKADQRSEQYSTLGVRTLRVGWNDRIGASQFSPLGSDMTSTAPSTASANILHIPSQRHVFTKYILPKEHSSIAISPGLPLSGGQSHSSDGEPASMPTTSPVAHRTSLGPATRHKNPRVIHPSPVDLRPKIHISEESAKDPDENGISAMLTDHSAAMITSHTPSSVASSKRKVRARSLSPSHISRRKSLLGGLLPASLLNRRASSSSRGLHRGSRSSCTSKASGLRSSRSARSEGDDSDAFDPDTQFERTMVLGSTGRMPVLWNPRPTSTEQQGNILIASRDATSDAIDGLLATVSSLSSKQLKSARGISSADFVEAATLYMKNSGTGGTAVLPHRATSMGRDLRASAASLLAAAPSGTLSALTERNTLRLPPRVVNYASK
jgi:hypothetical protein